MNVENILKIADWLRDTRGVDRERRLGFNMVSFRETREDISCNLIEHIRSRELLEKGCETVCCIAGTACELLLDEPTDLENVRSTATRLLGLDTYEAFALFYTNDHPKILKDITPAHAEHVLRHLAATGVVNWSQKP